MTGVQTCALPIYSNLVVAVFDFDGTLTVADSLLPFLREVAGRWRFWIGMVLLSPVFAAGGLGLMRRERLKEKLLREFLRGRTRMELEPVIARFIERRLQDLLNPRAMERLRQHQAQQHRIILLSASPELYLQPWAAKAGIAEVIATRLETISGTFTGRFDRLNCRGPEKVERLRAHLGDLSGYSIHAYGDSPSDRVLLERVEFGHYRTFTGGCLDRCRAVARFGKALV